MKHPVNKETLFENHIKQTEKWKKISSIFLYITRFTYLITVIVFCWVCLTLINGLENLNPKYLGYLVVVSGVSSIFFFATKAIDKFSFITSIALTNDLNKLENKPLSLLSIERTRDAFNYIYAMVSSIISVLILAIPPIVLSFDKNLLEPKYTNMIFILAFSFIIFALIKYGQYTFSSRAINNDIERGLRDHIKRNKDRD